MVGSVKWVCTVASPDMFGMLVLEVISVQRVELTLGITRGTEEWASEPNWKRQVQPHMCSVDCYEDEAAQTTDRNVLSYECFSSKLLVAFLKSPAQSMTLD